MMRENCNDLLAVTAVGLTSLHTLSLIGTRVEAGIIDLQATNGAPTFSDRRSAYGSWGRATSKPQAR